MGFPVPNPESVEVMIENGAFAEHVGMATIARCLGITGQMDMVASLTRAGVAKISLVTQVLEEDEIAVRVAIYTQQSARLIYCVSEVAKNPNMPTFSRFRTSPVTAEADAVVKPTVE